MPCPPLTDIDIWPVLCSWCAKGLMRDSMLNFKPRTAVQGNFSECAKGHVAYKPKRGDALMFFDLTVDYKAIDQASMHTGCAWGPVLRVSRACYVTYIFRSHAEHYCSPWL